MSETRHHPPNRPQHRTSSSSTLTAIIVGTIIGVLGFIAMALFLWERRRNRGVKKGIQTKLRSTLSRVGGSCRYEKDMDLETGVIHEPLPVYQR